MKKQTPFGLMKSGDVRVFSLLGLYTKKPERILDIMDRAVDNNPYQRPAMQAPPTVAVSATSDPTLVFTTMAAAGALTTAAIKQVAWYGGVPTPILTQYVCMPVASVLPSTAGNIGSGFADKNQWASAMEIMTDSDKVQFGIYMSNAVKVMFQVDGQYVDFAGVTGLGAASADTFLGLTFATRKVRRIRVLIPCLPSKGPCLVKSIRVSPTCSFWKPNQANVLRMAWYGDSYGEGTNGAASIYPIPNAAWPVLTGELLGIRDVRQLSVGSTGYLSDAAGARSKLRDQMPRTFSQGPFDIAVFAHGYNDSGFAPAAIQAEVLFCLQMFRQNFPLTPMVVLGCQAGAAGPNAAQIACDGAIGAAVLQFNDPLCKFVPVSTDTPTWLNGTGAVGATNGSGNSDFYVDPDKAHPNVAGAEYLSFRSAIGIRTAVASMAA
ncbi:hypothetical protein [Bradyrhizobium phage BDU-MI-1]|nr:hypothetical protein [Bradyrhizobium phage BDU-MI-1]